MSPGNRGLNAAHYPDDVDLTLTEPDGAMAAKLRRRLDALGRLHAVALAPMRAMVPLIRPLAVGCAFG